MDSTNKRPPHPSPLPLGGGEGESSAVLPESDEGSSSGIPPGAVPSPPGEIGAPALASPSPLGGERAGERGEAGKIQNPKSKSQAGSSAPATNTKPRKLTFKESRELEGMEAKILAREEDIARIEALFATPDFHRTHGTQTDALKTELAAAKDEVAKLYERWQELEAIKAEYSK